MHRKATVHWLTIVSAALLCLVAAGAAPPNARLEALGQVISSTPTAGLDTRADRLGELVNRARVAEGLKPLARSRELDQAAEAHSRDMVANNYLDHSAPDGTEPMDRARRSGYDARPGTGWIVVEVISAISGEPEGPLNWWLNDSPNVHGRVLRNTRWREMGVGYAAGGEYGNYWTVLVGCRPGVLPVMVLDGRTFAHEEECDQSTTTPVPTATTTAPPTATATALPTATPTPLYAAQLDVPTRATPAGSVLRVGWDRLPRPSFRHWVGVYSLDQPMRDAVAWSYVDCAGTGVLVGQRGECALVVASSAPPGRYLARLYAEDSYVPLTDGVPVEILPGGSTQQ